MVPSAVERNLDNKPDTGQAFSARSDAAGSVLSLGTTAPALESLGKSGGATPEWWADLEHVWRSRTSCARERLEVRAKRRAKQAREAPEDCPRLRVTAARAAEWADHRARAIALARQDVLASCEQRWRSVACGCTRHEFKVGCDQPQLCERCRAKHGRKWRTRIIRGMDAALRAARAMYYRTPAYRRRGMPPGIYLITLTAPHTGDLVADRERIGDAFLKLRKHATKHHWWSAYALTWEATSGTEGDGHMHMHLAVVSSWIPYRRKEVATDEDALQRWDSESPAARPRSPRIGVRKYTGERGLIDVWRDAIPGAVVLDVQPPRKHADAASTAGYYLAKYVTKGVDAAEFTGRKAGELLVALRGKRKVSTSADFWRDEEKRCSSCGDLYRSIGSPCALQDIAPGAVLRSMAERAGWFIPRGALQIGLRAVNSDTPMSLDPGPRTVGWVAD